MRTALAIILPVLSFAAACSDSGTAALPDLGPADLAKPAPDLLPAHPPGVTAIAGLGLSLPGDDLNALDGLVGEATVVGLGESIHTSGGFHDMKARIARWLIENKGFRLIAWEWQRYAGDVVEQYLQSDCTSGAAHAAKQLSVWGSTSIERFLEWSCKFNQAHPGDEVHFMGFDVQQPDVDLAKLSAWLPTSGMPDAAQLALTLQKCDRATAETYVGEYAPCMGALQQIDTHLTYHGAELEAQQGHAAVELIRIARAGAVAWQAEMFHYPDDYKASYEARDYGMAEVFWRLSLLRHPGRKAIVMAHDYHLRKAGEKVSGDYAIGASTMGASLATRSYGEYRAIAITGYDVEIDWPNVGCGPIGTPDGNDSLEAHLEEQGLGDVLIDFRKIAGDVPFAPAQEYGAGWYERMLFPEQYDGMVFLRHSAKMTPLAWPACQ